MRLTDILYWKDLHMDTKAYAVQSARLWPLILLLSIFCVISGCDRKIPEPGEPMIEQQDENAPPSDRTQSQDNDLGANR